MWENFLVYLEIIYLVIFPRINVGPTVKFEFIIRSVLRRKEVEIFLVGVPGRDFLTSLEHALGQ